MPSPSKPAKSSKTPAAPVVSPVVPPVVAAASTAAEAPDNAAAVAAATAPQGQVQANTAIDPATDTPNPAIRKTPLDVKVMAGVAKATQSLSPMSMTLATLDWAGHLAWAPGKRLDLLKLGFEQWQSLWPEMLHSGSNGVVGVQVSNGKSAAKKKPDRRFADTAWQQWPFNITSEAFLLSEEWWKQATTGLAGVSRHHEHVVSFMARQLHDLLSPGNYPLSNPVVLGRTLTTGGMNLAQGLSNFAQDFRRLYDGQPPVGVENFQVGKDVAATAGKVVLRNRLIELIQYSPTTGQVHPEPVLIVPAWIMKYYILDLSPHNSLIKYMVDQGHTVFCISWKNPGESEAALGMDDYLALGMEAALDAIEAIVPQQKVHAAGYCLGGTLLSIANATLARDGRDRLASMTLFTAQTDFTEPGELALFIDDSQLAMLEAQMRDVGYLQAGQMVGAFQLLNSYDLLWSRVVNEYLLGERSDMNDLMAWNADATRMPALMHAQYLRRLFLNNDLSGGRYPVRGKPVVLADIRTPIFCVATYTDHVAPWRSVYKLHYQTPAEITFVLTKGGHNAGIVSEPGRKNRYYQIQCRPVGGAYVGPDDWLEQAPREDGSWWPTWSEWIKARSGAVMQPPVMGAPEKGYPVVMDAPGAFVLEK